MDDNPYRSPLTEGEPSELTAAPRWLRISARWTAGLLSVAFLSLLATIAYGAVRGLTFTAGAFGMMIAAKSLLRRKTMRSTETSAPHQ